MATQRHPTLMEIADSDSFVSATYVVPSNFRHPQQKPCTRRRHPLNISPVVQF